MTPYVAVLYSRLPREDYNEALFVLRMVAIPSAIGEGVHMILSAGTEDGLAQHYPPAGASGAITVGGTDITDTRFADWYPVGFGQWRWYASNYGSYVDLFAPAEWVEIATHLSDSHTTSNVGTSFSAPLVAGIASLYLQGSPSASPAMVKNWVLSWATSGAVSDPMGSPNLLLFSPFGN